MTDKTPATDELQLTVELTFKPLPAGKHLRPEESQLLRAYIGEILKEIEEEEREQTPCK